MNQPELTRFQILSKNLVEPVQRHPQGNFIKYREAMAYIASLQVEVERQRQVIRAHQHILGLISNSSHIGNAKLARQAFLTK